MEDRRIEEELWRKGYAAIAGCDEVGRGCLFGPVVAAAVVFPPHLVIEGVRDSKKISPKKREKLSHIILHHAKAVGFGERSAARIDAVTIRQATIEAMKEAVENLTSHSGEIVIPDYLLVDAETIEVSCDQRALTRGEDQSQAIAAASIVAKVARDRRCLAWHDQYPMYGFLNHKGYGTKAHREALIQYGPAPEHRRSFLKKILDV